MASTLREGESLNKLCKEYFSDYDWTRRIGDIDLAICSQKTDLLTTPVSFLWCEYKAGTRHDIYESFIQLILTIGKAKTYQTELPPYFLGAGDAEKIAFVEYSKVMHIFFKTDFNWNVAPSNHGTAEFRELYNLLHEELAKDVVIFKFSFDSATLKKYIKKNFQEGAKGTIKIEANKNNFTFIYYEWLRLVKPSIRIDWDKMSKAGVLDCDFFLADLMSRDNSTIIDKLKVVLEKTKYKILRKVESDGLFSYSDINFKDEMKAHGQFWNRYERPPKPVYQKYILERRDLLVPQDIREIKGSYYTPEKWVMKAQEYLADCLGEGWQDEYYIWDCCAGSGNMLRGLTNTANIFASTLDDADVKIMQEAVANNRLNLLPNNIFQFDFLNDGYTKKDGGYISDLISCNKIPDSLREILKDPEKRRKLVIFINPPYAEAGDRKQAVGTGQNKEGVATKTCVYEKYKLMIKSAIQELFGQFFIRIYEEIPGCWLAEFSKLKILQAQNFVEFREIFKSRLVKSFTVPANTFDNVRGSFPIGFFIWDTLYDKSFESVILDVFDSKGNKLCVKKVSAFKIDDKPLSRWLSASKDKGNVNVRIGDINQGRNDFSNQNYCYIRYNVDDLSHRVPVTAKNLIQTAIYLSVRHCIEATWINDRDQFFAPKDGWQTDIEFQTDCLIYTLFHGQNYISCFDGINYWIPFYETEVGSPGTFKSRFMADFLHGKIKREAPSVANQTLFSEAETNEVVLITPMESMSDEAREVFEAGKKIWKYYFQQTDITDINASLYDIKGFFQGYSFDRNGKRKMNSDSSDIIYNDLMSELRIALKKLGKKIEPKVYYYEFLK